MNVNVNSLNETQLRWVNSPARKGRKVFQLPGNLFEWGEEACTMSLRSRYAQKRSHVQETIEYNLEKLRALQVGESAEIVKISTHPRHGNRVILVTRIA